MNKNNKNPKKKNNIISIYKKDSVGLFSGRYKNQEFASKKDKLDKLNKQNKQKGYKDYF